MLCSLWFQTRSRWKWTLGCLAACITLSATTMHADDSDGRVEGFEKNAKGWTFTNGEEFPGATGKFASDKGTAHGGKASYLLEADFTGGGGYVGAWCDIAGLGSKEINELRMWVKTDAITSLSFRALDSSGQYHQLRNLPLKDTKDWQEVAIKIAQISAGDYWGGDNDGKWHGPAVGIGINVEKDAIAGNQKVGKINIDDLKLVYGTVDESAKSGVDTDFESLSRDWTFTAGDEFPGAKGGFDADTSTARSGKQSYKLKADFTGGGAYVGAWYALGFLKGREVNEIKFWVKADGVSKIGVRVLDFSGQYYQKFNIELADTKDWQEISVKVEDLLDGDHWGGANDGRWHGPACGFGINIGKDDVPADKVAALNIDDARLVFGEVEE